MKCPQCQTEAAQVGNFWICPVHGQLAGPKPPEAEGIAILSSSVCLPPSLSPLRIFQLNPCLVRWLDLPDGEDGVKKYDRTAARAFPEILAKAGWEVCRR